MRCFTGHPFALLIAFLIVPASVDAQISVHGNTVHEIDGAPGAIRTGTIAITNPTRSPQVARLYLSDYMFYSDGTSRYDPPGSLRRSNSSWIQLGAQELTVPAGTTLPVHYTVRVPGIDSLTGSYWSLIMVEAVSAPSTATRGVGISANVRYAVQVVTHLANTGQRRFTVRSGKLAPGADGAGVALQLDIVNTGERATRFDVTTEVYDSTGTVVSRSQQPRGLTYPGSSLLHKVELGQLQRGSTYKAVVVIDAGGGSLTGAQYTLTP
jgi:hypothetical protein